MKIDELIKPRNYNLSKPRECRQVYAVYKGDQFICTGTTKELCPQLGIKPKTLQFYSTPSNHKRAENKNRLIAIKLGKDEIEDEYIEE